MKAIVAVVATLFLAATASAGTYTVTTTADSGPGSFRAALAAGSVGGDCERPCTIEFAIPGPVPADGYFTIRPLSPLPVLVADSLTIDGTTQARTTGDTNRFGPEIELDGSLAGYRSGIKLGRVVGMLLRGLAINRFQGHGVLVDNSSNVQVTGCYIGVDPTGTQRRANGMDGVAVTGAYGGVTISDNIISGNSGNGVYVTGFYRIDVTGNRIGVARDLSPMGNGANGVDMTSELSAVDSNVIAHNAHFGVAIGEPGRVRIQRNAMYANGLMSIGLGHDGPDSADAFDSDGGPNGRVNAPVLLSARSMATLPGFYVGDVVATGRIHTHANIAVTIDAYAAPYRGPLGHAEANQPVASVRVNTDANGNAEFTIRRGLSSRTLLLPNGWLALTATTDEGTSEFSAPVPLQSDTIPVTTTADAGPGSLRDAITRANQGGCTSTAPCWITFAVPHQQLTEGVAVIEPLSPLPVITSAYVRVDGSSQTWNASDTNPNGPEVEIRGTRAGAGAGLKFGTAADPVVDAFVYELAVTGFDGPGISVDAPQLSSASGFDALLENLLIGIDPVTGAARGNSGPGILVRGTRPSQLSGTRSMIRGCRIGGNGGHGVHLDGQAMTVSQSQIGIVAGVPRPNGGAGIFTSGTLDFVLSHNTIAFNTGAGIATAPGTRAVTIIESSIHSNGGLGIDRNADGAGSGAGDVVTPPPVITSATYDPAKNVTVVEGELAASAPSLPFQTDGREELQLHFFANDVADSSGFGEGAQILTRPFPITAFAKGTRFSVSLPGSFSGKFVSATSSLALCYYEFGCYARDTSEFSNAFRVP